MKIWDKFKGAAYNIYAQTFSTPLNPGTTTSNLDIFRGRTFFGVDNSQLVTNETIFSVITRLANTVSSLPLKLYNNFEIQNDSIADLLISPNANISGWELINKLEVSRNEYGNAYAVILRDERLQPIEIVQLDNSIVSVFVDSDSGEIYYEVRGQHGTAYIHNANMIHLKHITGTHRIVGISPLDVLKNALAYDKAVQEFSLSEMEKKESFKLTYGANVTPEKQAQVVASFRRFYDENGGVLFQEPGVTIDEMRKSYTANDTASAERITRTRVANVFNVPLSFLNEQGGTFSSNEQLMIQFVQMTLMPIIRQYENEFNRKLLNQSQRSRGLYFKFNLNGLLRADTATRANFYQQGIRNGWFTNNEIRQFEDLPPSQDEQANHLWISGDLYPINIPILERNATSPITNSIEGGDN